MNLFEAKQIAEEHGFTVARSKKADIVLSKATGAVYVDPSLDITDDVIKFLNEDDDNSRTSSSNFNNRRR